MSELTVIAEIGINANGKLADAKKLIKMAKDCGADYVKFQKRTIDVVYDMDFLDTKRESPFGTTQRHQKAGLEFSKEDYDKIDEYCKKLGISWFASAWDLEALEFISDYKCIFNKVASAMLTNREFVSKVAAQKKHTYISTGMSTIQEIDWAVEEFKRNKTTFTLMHAVGLYPCPDDQCNIKMMATLKKKFNCEVGYSGHELGMTPSLLAIAGGAIAIERHITLDRAGYGSDQPASLEKRGLEILIREGRLIHSMLGDGKKEISNAEKRVAKKLRYWMET